MEWIDRLILTTVCIAVFAVVTMLLPVRLDKWVVKKTGSFKKLLNFEKLKKVSIITTVFMLLTHLYIWVNGVFLFDTSGIYRGIPEKKLTATDTWLRPLTDYLFDGGVNLPWLSGVWAILFMIVSVYCITEVLEIEKTWAICLIAGLCSSNTAIICQNEFAGGAHIGELALAFASLALWFIKQEKIHYVKRTIIGAIMITLSIATYGAYVSIVPSLMLCLLCIDIVKGVSGKENWKKAFSYLFQFLTGIVLFYVILRILMLGTGAQLTAYANEENLTHAGGFINMIKCIPLAYKRIIKYYVARSNYLPQSLSWLLYGIMLSGCLLAVYWIYRNWGEIKNKRFNIPLLILIIALMPMAVNFIDIVSVLYTRYLMIFTYVVPLIFWVKLIQEVFKEREKSDEKICEKFKLKGSRFAVFTAVIIGVFLYYSIVMSNALHVKYVNSYNRSLSLGTRILDRIETCEGFEGTERVVLIGDMHNQSNEYFIAGEENEPEIINADLGMAGVYYPKGISYGYMTEWLLHNSLDLRMRTVYYPTIFDYQEWEDIDKELVEQLEDMEEFPTAGSVKKIGNQIYVIFSKYERPYADCIKN